jgi:hypothetical protein
MLMVGGSGLERHLGAHAMSDSPIERANRCATGSAAEVIMWRLRVGGSATLAGALSIIDDPGTYTVGSRYTILTAAGGPDGDLRQRWL